MNIFYFINFLSISLKVLLIILNALLILEIDIVIGGTKQITFESEPDSHVISLFFNNFERIVLV